MRFIQKLLLFTTMGMLATSVFATDSASTNTPPAQVATTSQVTAPAQVVDGKVNINTATVEQLQKILQNVGRKKAQAIVDYRQKNGAFTSIEQLTDVPGIGPATLERNRDKILL